MNKIVSKTELLADFDRLVAEAAANGDVLTVKDGEAEIATIEPSAGTKQSSEPRKSLFGSMKGTAVILGDIVSPIEDAGWELLPD
ncbi:hypothetical protein D3874_15375 [Oleomonas cavernae]|uniref:Uncharacterized protein n=1 Tax=Oleomonas cavernae TaxID=2320859 RepID=A0A418WE31_9PROT|nr:hypothetical protein [Oleomonas cavernae]RJF88226.1 hypothetical protein D3874_15375 [Oleomonas cavernae]